MRNQTERYRFSPVKMSCRSFLLTISNHGYLLSSWWPLCYFSRSLTVFYSASSLHIVSSRFSVSPLHTPPPHQKSVQVQHNTEEIVHKLFNFKSSQGNSYGRERVLRNFWVEILAEKAEILAHCHLRYAVSTGKSGSTRFFRWVGELSHVAFPTCYGLQTCLFLGFG